MRSYKTINSLWNASVWKPVKPVWSRAGLCTHGFLAGSAWAKTLGFATYFTLPHQQVYQQLFSCVPSVFRDLSQLYTGFTTETTKYKKLLGVLS